MRLADFDLDGDLDVGLAIAGATTVDSIVAWYENVGDGSAWTPHVIATNVVRTRTLVAADLDGDGDPDLAAGSVGTDGVFWWENRGGQAALPTTRTAPSTLEVMTLDDVLEITAIHRGKTGDGDAEVAAITLHLRDEMAAPLSDAEADALLYGLYVFEDDDDSGDFDPAFDSEVAAVSTFSLTDGVLTVMMADGDDKLRLTPTRSRTLFVAIAFESDAPAQSPGQIEITHLVGSSVVEDRDHDLPLTLERSPNVSSGIVTPTSGPELIFADDFESGDLSAWSSSS